ncbi:MAG: FAD-binding oxidoreductase [Sphingobium sp.]|nr:FAD-binding oxidoreductase [Sphingobium sp.]
MFFSFWKEKSVKTPILFVGGGIVALASANILARAGHAVQIIEPDHPPRGASWGNAGHIAVEQVEPLASMAMVKSLPKRLYCRGGAASLPLRSATSWLPFSLRLLSAARPARHRQGTAVLKQMLANAFPAWKRLTEATDTAHLLLESGHYIVWESADAAKEGMRAWMAADSGTARFRPATRAEIERIERLTDKPLAGAIYCEGSGQIADTGLLADGLRNSLLKLGGILQQGRVVAIRTEGGKAVADLEDGRMLRPAQIIVTAGARSGELLRPLGHNVPIIDERGYHIQSPVSEEAWPAAMPPVVFEERSMIATRFTSGLRAASFVEFSAPHAPADKSKWERLHQHASAVGLPIAGDAAPWFGSRPTLPDYLPAIGRSDKADNLYYAFGHQHLGLTLAATTGESLAALLSGDAPSPHLSLERFG